MLNRALHIAGVMSFRRVVIVIVGMVVLVSTVLLVVLVLVLDMMPMTENRAVLVEMGVRGKGIVKRKGAQQRAGGIRGVRRRDKVRDRG